MVYTGIGTRLYTQSGQDSIGLITPLKVYTVGHRQSSAGPYILVEKLLGTATSNSTCELPALRVLQWCADILQETGSGGPSSTGTLHIQKS